jgi:membrane protease YdiL (CAAX protease family)
MLQKIRQLRERAAEALERVERESLTAQADRQPGTLDVDVIGVTILACVVLTTLEFWGGSSDWDWLATLGDQVHHSWGTIIRNFFDHGDYSRLYRLGYWSLSTCVGYLIVPAIWVKVAMGRSLRETGMSFEGMSRHAWLYLAMYLLVLPAVWFVSGAESFQSTYPFYDQAGRSLYDFLLWEFLYALQFLSLEFFFRGFLVHGLKDRFGFYAIFVSTIPYCMIHFGKPPAEAFGSVIAGITLGIFSLFTGSIWLGVLIHVSVAVTMDVFAL